MTTVTITGAPRANQLQKWDFTAHVTLPHGATVKSCTWTFDKQASGVAVGIKAPGFVWEIYGNRTVTATVIDSKGGKTVASHVFNIPAPITPAPVPTPAPSPQPPAPTLHLHEIADFDAGQNSAKPGAANYGWWLKTDLRGDGSASTVYRIKAHTSTKKGAVPGRGNGKGGLANPTNNMYVLRVDGDNRTLTGLTIAGTDQGHLYNGIRCDNNNGLTLNDITIRDIPGNSSANPGETFLLNMQRTGGKAFLENVKLIGGAGWAKSAAALGLNSNTATTVIEGLLTQNLTYSAGIATWQQRGRIDIHGWTHDSPTRSIGAERLAAPLWLHDPNYPRLRTTKGTHDATYTWGDHEGGNYRDGAIIWNFSTDTALARCLGPKRKKFIVLTNPQSAKQGIKRSVRVLVAGKDRTADLLAWKGA